LHCLPENLLTTEKEEVRQQRKHKQTKQNETKKKQTNIYIIAATDNPNIFNKNPRIRQFSLFLIISIVENAFTISFTL